MTNELHRESSLYLRQHQNNPVNWLPWTKNAFERANHEHKPIFLSIGYSSCHWCHVMAHESFEDDDVAKLLNKDFICIKLDKEERPDIDHIYQKAHYIFAQRPGGWPLSVFMTPNQEPFYIATFLPKFSKYNLPGMIELIPRIAELYKSDLEITKEPYTYLSRDDQGRALYATHHFSEEELKCLMQSAGFRSIRIDKKRETSSRRNSQAAYFYYCYCRKPTT